MKAIDKLIINSPYEEPKQYWQYNRPLRRFDLEGGRRPAGYIIASESSKSFDDPGEFVEIKLVNEIRPRVKRWREAGYPGVTGITKRLLEHWKDPEQRVNNKFFFCQLESIETLIWLAEAPDAEKVGVEIPSDGGDFARYCCKMATGSGKTIVMAMLIAWQILNKVTYQQDSRFSKNVFVVAPGLTVKSRLQVLIPSCDNNYYDAFNVVPSGLTDKLRQGKVIIKNWQALNWEDEEKLAKKKTVDKRGPKSDEAYVREALGEMAGSGNIIVINDEAHHAWRVPAGSKIKGVDKQDIDEATKWVGGLDRIDRARKILKCYDFSATPFVPTGKRSTDETLFGWIVSDFGLNDAIESGLVKTPRIVIRDDSKAKDEDFRSKLYHIYRHVSDDLNRKVEETEPLPQLVKNAYMLLGQDWLETKKDWESKGIQIPPVMISVANRTETSARINFAFGHKQIPGMDVLCDSEKTLHIDSKVLDMAESLDEGIIDSGPDTSEEDGYTKKKTKKEQAEDLRKKVDTVGKIGEKGEQIQNVISVGMLSEGWDAKTVTHIMGLRAFSSQLLCEQVVGRGLRRTNYEVDVNTGLFEAEYVNIFGVPFTFLPHESHDGPPKPPTPPKTRIAPEPAKAAYEIKWPNLIRVDHTYKPVLSLDMDKVKPLRIDGSDEVTIAQLAAVIDGKPDFKNITEIDLEKLGKRYRMQKLIFEAARDVYEMMKPSWKGNREFLLAQIIRLTQDFIRSDKLVLPHYYDDARKRILIALNMTAIVHHIWEAIRFENSETIVPVFDTDRPIKSTANMPAWYSGKRCYPAAKSHINFCVYDSGWEDTEAFKLDHNQSVTAWVKNDHLGFEIIYTFNGIIHKYRPDFIIKLKNGNNLILEVKGQDTQQDKAKREFLDEWVKAVNQHGGFGKWTSAVSFGPSDVDGIIKDVMKA